jgi:hypothetical protein
MKYEKEIHEAMDNEKFGFLSGLSLKEQEEVVNDFIDLKISSRKDLTDKQFVNLAELYVRLTKDLSIKFMDSFLQTPSLTFKEIVHNVSRLMRVQTTLGICHTIYVERTFDPKFIIE